MPFNARSNDPKRDESEIIMYHYCRLSQPYTIVSPSYSKKMYKLGEILILFKMAVALVFKPLLNLKLERSFTTNIQLSNKISSYEILNASSDI